MLSQKTTWRLISIFLIGIISSAALAAPAAEPPKLVIIIDNLGDQEQPGVKVANLPGQVTCSILPYGRYSAKIAELCHAQNKTVVLNTPMQAKNNYPLGPGGLQANMSKQAFMQTLAGDMASVPYIQGVDNQMGSLLTSEEQPMSWLMEAIKPHGLFFLDNKTTPHSVAGRIAKEKQIPFISRDIFLDDVRTPEAVHKQFTEALKIAKRYGVAVIVAHPYAFTLTYLQAELPNLAAQGYQLASIPQVLNVSIEPVTLSAVKPVITTTNKNESVKAITPVVINKTVPAKPVTEKTPIAKIPPVSKAQPATEPAVTPAKPAAKPAVVIPPASAQPGVSKQPPAAEKPSANKPSDKKNKENDTIVVPAITGSEPEPSLELSVDKDHQIIVNTINQTTTTQTSAPQVETIQLDVPTRNAETSGSDNQTANKSGLLSRLSDKFSQFFHDKKSTTTEKVAENKTITPVTVSVQNIPVNKQPAKSVSINSQEATAKASHSLLQTLKDNLCQKYSHFCEHKAETAITAQAQSMNAPFIDLQGKLQWPTPGSISTHFGAEMGDSKLKYNGVLIQAPEGQPVHAIYKGRVIFANWLQGLGLLLIIDHGNGYMSLYGHNEALYKKVGDVVKPQDLIAAVGNSGAPGPTGLYFEIRHNGQPINPEQWCG